MVYSYRDGVSLVVVAYNMARELPRTLLSLSRVMQRRIADIGYEILVMDNGSDPPVGGLADPEMRVLRVENAPPSPARAINIGIAECRYDFIGVLIDGARIASPGLVHHARLASRLHARPVIGTLGFHLGPKVQRLSIAEGYTRELEDELVASSGWERDAYRLFDIAVFAESSQHGWFAPVAEGNALFMPRWLWDELGGYDETFTSPGGGLVNLDVYERACALERVQVIRLLGEATFHQLHGGVSTTAATSRWEEFHAEYVERRRKRYVVPAVDTLYIGRWSTGTASPGLLVPPSAAR